MTPPPRPRRNPYWTIPALLILLSVPLYWSVALLATVIAVRAGVALAHPALARWALRRAAAARGETVALGTDRQGHPVTLQERQLAAHGLIVGASGAGKSTTLLGILSEQIVRGRPVIAIDLKGSPAFTQRLQGAAAAAGRPLRIWTPDGPEGWNPLAVGNATELKDKLIATERFSEPHYQRAAERYVQTAIGALHAGGRDVDLLSVVALMDPRRLSVLARGLRPAMADRVQDYLGSLTRDQLSAVRGFGTRLALLSEGTAGPFLSGAPANPVPIDLRRALAGDEIVVFSLNSGRYGQLAAQLGTLAIQDLVSATGHRLQGMADGSTPPLATIAVDEFSALGSDQVLALLARGREAGVSVLLATQELSDLERAGRGFRDQVLGLTALKIAHRQDVPGSARTFAEMAGSEQVWEETHTIQSPFGTRPRSRGTRRAVSRLVVHPDEIARLPTGEAVMLSKTPVSSVTRVRVNPAPRPASSTRAPAAPKRPAAPARRDQDPGVTR
ncbi:MAG: type IV secretion system DNA-binding domain-containing protein [Solirubrobacteraceae bacterium]